MIESLITVLRDKNTSILEFRLATLNICDLLVAKVAEKIKEKKVSVATPLKKTFGKKIDEDILLVPILRSGMAFLPAFMKAFPKASVGFMGIRRDEKTALPHIYYENIPNCKNLKIIALDPMIATGGSTIALIKRLIVLRVKQENIHVVSIISSKKGIKTISGFYPKVELTSASTDPILDKNKFIVPGLGDFGDRFFGT